MGLLRQRNMARIIAFVLFQPLKQYFAYDILSEHTPLVLKVSEPLVK